MITIDNILFAYPRGGWLFRNFSLEIADGHIVGLLGANSTGKSTLLKLICGLLTPQRGNVKIEGIRSNERSVELMSRVVVVPEEFVLPNISIIDYARANAPFYPCFDHSQMVAALEAFEVDTTKKLNSMSMGQRKKALLSFALACNTDYLLLDEPTNGLDIPSKGVFRRLLASWATPERTVIICTHQVKDIENLIDHIVMIDNRGLIIDSSIATIGERLSFESRPTKDGAIYAEPSLGGYSVVVANNSNDESNIDIELLFNAASNSRNDVKELLSNRNEF